MGIITDVRNDYLGGGDTIESESFAPEGSSTTSGFKASPAIGTMVSKGLTTALSNTGIADIPGATGTIGRAAGGIVTGVAPEDVAIDAAIGLAAPQAYDAITGMGVPGMLAGPAVGLGIDVGKAAIDGSRMDVAATKSAARSGGMILGGLALGPIGSFVGGSLAGYFAQGSLEGGVLGDALGSRSHETTRDSVEADYKKAGISYFDALGYSDAVANDPGAGINDMSTASAGQKGIGNPGSYGGTTTQTDMYGGQDGQNDGSGVGMGGNMDDGGNSSDNDSQGGYGGASDEEGDGENW